MKLEELEELKEMLGNNHQTVIIDKGINAFCLLGMVFIVLKALGYITWSWIWVLCPFWMQLCFWIIVFLFTAFILKYFKKYIYCSEREDINQSELTEQPVKDIKNKKESIKPRRRNKKSVKTN